MKICPFISHMIGEDSADILQIETPSKSSASTKGSSKNNKDEEKHVVILGYDGSGGDGESSVGVQTKPAKTGAKAKKSASSVPSHLFCLKDTCRFFMKKESACKFDTVLDLAQAHSDKIESVEKQTMRINDVESRLDSFSKLDQLDKLKKLDKIDAVDDILGKIAEVQAQIKKVDTDRPDKSGEKTAAKVTRELDKFWKFQTKSVSEMIAGLGDSEKKQQQSLTQLKQKMDQSLEKWKPDVDMKDVKDVKASVDKLRESVESREDGIENFSTTVSELVLNIDDTLKVLQEKNEMLAGRIEKLEESMPQFDTSIDKLGSMLMSKLENSGNDDVSGEIKSLDQRFNGQFEDVKRAHDLMAKNFDAWRKDLDKQTQETGKSQGEWKKKFERIEKNQTDVMNLLQQSRVRVEDDSSRLRKKEAKKFNNLGVTSFHNGEFELARDQFLEAVELDPKFAESWNNLGLVYTEMQNDDGAREAFSKAIDINPDLPAAYNNLGYIYYKQYDFDKAVEMYQEAIDRSSDNSSAHTNLGNAYFKLDKREEARRAWERALEIDPGNEKASRNLSRLEQD